MLQVAYLMTPKPSVTDSQCFRIARDASRICSGLKLTGRCYARLRTGMARDCLLVIEGEARMARRFVDGVLQDKRLSHGVVLLERSAQRACFEDYSVWVDCPSDLMLPDGLRCTTRDAGVVPRDLPGSLRIHVEAFLSADRATTRALAG